MSQLFLYRQFLKKHATLFGLFLTYNTVQGDNFLLKSRRQTAAIFLFILPLKQLMFLLCGGERSKKWCWKYAQNRAADVRQALDNPRYADQVWPERLESGGRLPTVETEVHGDSKSTNERGPSLVGSVGFSCWYTRFLFYLGCSSRPSFFLTVHYWSLSPLPSKLGRQPCWVSCLLGCVSGYPHFLPP